MDLSNKLDEYNKLLQLYDENVRSRFRADQYLEYNEILFSAHSCGIEGNTFSVNDTRDLKEKGIGFKLLNKSLFEAYEILDHFKAYEYLMSNITMPLSEELLIETQRLVTCNTIEYSKKYKPGEYTKEQMGAGDTIFPDFETSIKSIPILLQKTQEAIDAKSSHPVEISAKFHQYFIYLHPFPDGNGRTGRLLSNFILAKFGHPLIIIKKEDKEQYIQALKTTQKYRDMDIITDFFCTVSIKRMRDEILQQKNIAEDQGTVEDLGKKNKRGMSFIF